MTATTELRKERDPFFDSLKFVLIFLVVFGHSMQKSLDDGSGDHLIFSMFMSIYAFHMPLFIILTGYFSKNMTWAKFKKSTPSLIVTYFIFQTILCIPIWINKGFDPLQYFVNAQYSMWYLQVIIVWRLIFCFVPKRRIMFPILLILSVVATLIIGYKIFVYIPTIIRWVTFLPYFIVGYYFKKEWFDYIRSWNKLYTFLLFAAFLLGIYVFLTLHTSIAFLAPFPYKAIYPDMPWQGLIDRAITFPVAIFSACLVINLCPTRFSNWGKYTLPIYLLHSVFIYVIYIPYLKAYSIAPSIFTHFVVAVALTALCLYLSKLRAVQCLVDPVNYYKKLKQ